MKYDYNKLWLELVSSSNECIVQSLSCRLGESLWSPLKFSLKKRLHLPLRYGIGIALVNIFKFKCKPTQTDLDLDLSLTLWPFTTKTAKTPSISLGPSRPSIEHSSTYLFFLTAWTLLVISPSSFNSYCKLDIILFIKIHIVMSGWHIFSCPAMWVVWTTSVCWRLPTTRWSQPWIGLCPWP